MTVTLTDTNYMPLSRNYTVSLTVIENPDLFVDLDTVIVETKQEEVTISFRSLYSDGTVILQLSQPLLAEKYEEVIQNLTNSF